MRQFLCFFALGGLVAAVVSWSIGPLFGVALGIGLVLVAVQQPKGPPSGQSPQ